MYYDEWMALKNMAQVKKRKQSPFKLFLQIFRFIQDKCSLKELIILEIERIKCIVKSSNAPNVISN